MVKRIDRASRLIMANPATIYRAFLEPALLVRWLPPEGASARVDKLEAYEGGRISLTLHFSADGRRGGKTTAGTDVVQGHFVKLRFPSLIVQRFRFVSNDAAFAGEMLMTWTLRECAPGTEATVMAEDVPIGIPADVHEAAMASSLSKLAALSAEIAAG